mmetsp:Transcript_3930/g.15648  ORF Transcript_3930/g.15648 Transcript_3930/m.15648 type:complete len:301 (+) Transcript_3930:688-1590(+)
MLADQITLRERRGFGFGPAADGVELRVAVVVREHDASGSNRERELVLPRADFFEQRAPLGHERVRVRQGVVAHQRVIDVLRHQRQIHVPVGIAPALGPHDRRPGLRPIARPVLKERIHPHLAVDRLFYRRRDGGAFARAGVVAEADVSVLARRAVHLDVHVHGVHHRRDELGVPSPHAHASHRHGDRRALAVPQLQLASAYVHLGAVQRFRVSRHLALRLVDVLEGVLAGSESELLREGVRAPAQLHEPRIRLVAVRVERSLARHRGQRIRRIHRVRAGGGSARGAHARTHVGCAEAIGW